MYLDAEITRVRMPGSDLRRRFSHAEADFEDSRRLARKYSFEVEQPGRIHYAEGRQQRIQCVLLRAGNTSLAKDEAADGSLAGGHWARMIASGLRATMARARNS